MFMGKRMAILWVVGSAAMFLVSLAALVWPDFSAQPAHHVRLGALLGMIITSVFGLVGLVGLMPSAAGANTSLPARMRRYLEPRVPMLMAGLALLVFGVTCVFAMLAGSMLEASVLLVVVLVLMSILEEHRKKLMVHALLNADTDAPPPRGKQRTAKATFKWLKAQLKTVDALKGRRYEIVRVQPAHCDMPDTPAERRPMTVTVEINDWRESIQLALCVIGYYLAVVLAWWAWFGFHGQDTSALDLGRIGFALSILVLPAMLIALAARLAAYQALAVALVAMMVHVMMLRSDAADAENLIVGLVRDQLPVVGGIWLVGLATLIAIERLTARLLGMQMRVEIDGSR